MEAFPKLENGHLSSRDLSDLTCQYLQMLVMLNGFSHGDLEHKSVQELLNSCKHVIKDWENRGVLVYFEDHSGFSFASAMVSTMTCSS